MHPDSGSGGGTSTTVAVGFGRDVTFLTTFAFVPFVVLLGSAEVFDDLALLVDAAGLFGAVDAAGLFGAVDAAGLFGVVGLWGNGVEGLWADGVDGVEGLWANGVEGFWPNGVLDLLGVGGPSKSQT